MQPNTPTDDTFRLIVEAAPNAIVVIDETGRIVVVNSQTEKLFGYRREEILGRPIELLVPERFRANHPGVRENFFVDARARPMGAGRDLFGLRKDGTEFPVEIGLNPIRTNQGMLVLSAIVDITERQRAEKRFRLAIESAPSGMVMVDGRGNIVLMNSQAKKLFGYGREELIGKPVELLVPERFGGAHPSYRQGFFKNPESRPNAWHLDVHVLDGHALAGDLQQAIKNYYERLASSVRRELREHLMMGQLGLLGGVAIFLLSMGLRQLLQSTLGDVPRILDEGLIILAWIALWRPVEVLAYEWVPLVRKRRLYVRLAAIRVAVRTGPSATAWVAVAT
jgi:PAS domain S-box-containing protein